MARGFCVIFCLIFRFNKCHFFLRLHPNKKTSKILIVYNLYALKFFLNKKVILSVQCFNNIDINLHIPLLSYYSNFYHLPLIAMSVDYKELFLLHFRLEVSLP